MLRRERDVFQIGFDPSRAVRLGATDAVRRTLDAIAEGRPLLDCDPGVVADLDRLGVLTDGPPDRAAPEPRVHRFGQPLPTALRLALERAGLEEPLGEGTRLPTGGPVLLLVGVGEPRRELLDELVSAGVAHLLLRFSEGDAVIGPFVVPGATACLRCVDAHLGERDPRWSLLVEQQARLTARPRRDGVADPVDPLLAQLAVSWAARDLATAARPGAEAPATWSTTIRLPPDLAGFEATGWMRHPGCGCSLDGPTPSVTRPG